MERSGMFAVFPGLMYSDSDTEEGRDEKDIACIHAGRVFLPVSAAVPQQARWGR
jgi:hypothetical protein